MSLSRIYNFSVTSNKKSSFGLFISQCSGTCGLEDVLTGIHVSIQAGTHVCMLAYTNPDTLSLLLRQLQRYVYLGSFHLMLNRTGTPLRLSFLLGIPRRFLLQKFLSLPLSLLS